MEKTKQKGFVLIIVIAAMATVGVEMFFLTSSSNFILFQTQTAYLESCECNLVASGLAWAEFNIKNENVENFNEKIELNIVDMNIRKADLSIAIERPVNKQVKVQLSTCCTTGRQTIRHKKEYQIKL